MYSIVLLRARFECSSKLPSRIFLNPQEACNQLFKKLRFDFPLTSRQDQRDNNYFLSGKSKKLPKQPHQVSVCNSVGYIRLWDRSASETCVLHEKRDFLAFLAANIFMKKFLNQRCPTHPHHNSLLAYLLVAKSSIIIYAVKKIGSEFGILLAGPS